MFQWQCEDPVKGSQGACYEAPVELKTPEYVKHTSLRFDLLTVVPIRGARQVLLSH